MRNAYYLWLISLVCDKNYDSKYYSKLLFDLDQFEFTWANTLDENRYLDGIHLRDRFNEENGLYPREGPCTVLEMMVGLACRIELEYLEEGGANELFWGMINSLGLYRNDDYHYKSEKTSIAINNMLNRHYDRNGKGGLFTVVKPRADFRDVQIWQQAMWYVTELYSERNKGWI